MAEMKKNSLWMCIFLLLLPALQVWAQQIFPTYGKIEFECKTNLHKQLDEGWWDEEYKSRLPKFRTSYFNLFFKNDLTLFVGGKESDEKIPNWLEDERREDVIYSNLTEQTFVKKQQVFEQLFLLSDSIRKVEWKITNETRTIAGFECRKAVGKLLDSIYVIAFYTDQIATSGGPLSFCNLPGMILGLAIPRMSTTWYATKLEWVEPSTTQLAAPTKGKKTTYANLQKIISQTVEDWGKWGRKFSWQAML
jgi:GLPGLI family protein